MIRLRPDLLPQTTVYVGPTTAPPPPNLAALLPPAPALRLSVAEVRGLLRALLPLPRLDLRAAVALLRYQRRHKLAAYWSHRKRRLQRLADLHPPSLLVVILGCDAGIQCLLESALGIERAFDIARAHERVIGVGLGEADLRADLGVSGDSGLAYARARIVVAARAAGLPGPTQSVYTDIRDLDGLRCSSEEGKGMGFMGRSVIHPAQIAVVNEVFTPTEDEVRRARDLVDRLDKAAVAGTGAFALEDGHFVDRAVVEAARRTLALVRGGLEERT